MSGWIKIGAFACLVALGCGGSGGRRGLDSRDAVLVAGDFFGTESLLGRITFGTAVLRMSDNGVEAIDVGVAEPLSSVFGRPLTFSSPTVAWAIAATDEARRVLISSEDFGSSWTVVDSLPFAVAAVLDVHVDATTTGALTAWVAVLTGGDGLPVGPEVWSRPLDRQAAWVRHHLGTTRGCCRRALFAQRTGRLELLRDDSFCLYDPDPEITLDTIAGDGGSTRIDLLRSFTDFHTLGDRGWIAGARSSDPNVGFGSAPAIVHLAADAPPRLQDLPGVAAGSAAAVDFVDEERGTICGIEHPSGPSFCFHTEDGGLSWIRSELPALAFRFAITDVARTSDGGGFGVLRNGLRAAVIETSDGGQSWQETALPPLGRSRLGALVRSSAAPDPLDGAGPIRVAPVPTATPAQPPGPATEAAPLAFVVGDSSTRGATITGVAFRSQDLGTTWEEILAVPGGSLSGVTFPDARSGWVVGAGRVFRTDDGGTSFTDQTGGVELVDRLLDVRAVTAADGARAAIVAEVERAAPPYEELEALLFTADGGGSWRVAARTSDLVPFSNRVEGGPCLARGGQGIAVVGSRVFLTADAGATWAPGPSFEWRYGEDGSSSSGDGFLAPQLACSGESDLWIVVSGLDPRQDALWHSPDGGGSWENLTDAVGRIPLYPSVGSFLASGRGWLVIRDQEATSLLRTRDRGESWTALPAPLLSGDGGGALELPEAIAFADDRRGLMVTGANATGGSGVHPVLATQDGGATWTRSALPRDFHPLALSFVR